MRVGCFSAAWHWKTPSARLRHARRKPGREAALACIDFRRQCIRNLAAGREIHVACQLPASSVAANLPGCQRHGENSPRLSARTAAVDPFASFDQLGRRITLRAMTGPGRLIRGGRPVVTSPNTRIWSGAGFCDCPRHVMVHRTGSRYFNPRVKPRGATVRWSSSFRTDDFSFRLGYFLLCSAASNARLSATMSTVWL